VRAVFVTFGKRKDSKTGQPLFYEESWKKAKNLLHEISEGLYSDPPGFKSVHLRSGQRWKCQERFTNGIPFLFCSRGTNQVESIHRQYNTMFLHISGIEMGDALFRDVIVTTWILLGEDILMFHSLDIMTLG
jgi:hypothetical protein